MALEAGIDDPAVATGNDDLIGTGYCAGAGAGEGSGCELLICSPSAFGSLQEASPQNGQLRDGCDVDVELRVVVFPVLLDVLSLLMHLTAAPPDESALKRTSIFGFFPNALDELLDTAEAKRGGGGADLHTCSSVRR